MEVISPKLDRPLNILVTSVSKKTPLIKTIRNANLELNNSGRLFAADSDKNCIGKYFVDEFWCIPKLENLSVEDIAIYCHHKDIKCIIPTRDGELSFFAKHKDTLRKQGIHIMVPDFEPVAICLDKLLFYRTANSLSFPAIETVISPDDLNCASYVVKPRHGAGGCNIGLNLVKNDAITHAAMTQDPVYQPYIEGREFSIDLFVDAHGKAKGVVARVREKVIKGESQITVTTRNEQLEWICSSLAEKLNLYGHVMFQAIVDYQGKVHLIECNSRFGGASTLSVQVGLNSIVWFLLESSGFEIKGIPFVRSPIEKRLVRYAEDLFLDDSGF